MTPAPTRLLLVRHGEVDDDYRGRCYGRTDVPLSPRGQEQARGLVSELQHYELTAVYSSPLRRARETATPLAAARGLPVVIVRAFAELDFGRLEGLTFAEIEDCYPEAFDAWMNAPTSVSFPDGESYRELEARVGAALSRIVARHEGQTVAVVTHAGAIRAALAAAGVIPAKDSFEIDLPPAGTTVVEITPAGAGLVPFQAR